MAAEEEEQEQREGLRARPSVGGSSLLWLSGFVSVEAVSASPNSHDVIPPSTGPAALPSPVPPRPRPRESVPRPNRPWAADATRQHGHRSLVHGGRAGCLGLAARTHSTVRRASGFPICRLVRGWSRQSVCELACVTSHQNWPPIVSHSKQACARVSLGVCPIDTGLLYASTYSSRPSLSLYVSSLRASHKWKTDNACPTVAAPHRVFSSPFGFFCFSISPFRLHIPTRRRVAERTAKAKQEK